MFNTVSARQLQREYKKVLEKANKSKDPVIVVSNNKPQAAIVSLDILEEIRLNRLEAEAMEEYRKGKTTSISTEEELQAFFDEIREAAK